MGLVYIDDVKPGMTLEKDLVCPNGRFLLGAGAVFETKHIKIAKSWGITETFIVGKDKSALDSEAEAAYSNEILETAEQILNINYRNVDKSSEVVKEIYRISKLAAARELASGSVDVEKVLKGIEIPPMKAPEDVKGKLTPEVIISKEIGLTSFPDVYYKINEVLNSPTSSAAHMADVVEKDTSLSAKLLKIVNSAFYSFPSKIDSIRRAITIIGTKELATLAVGISAIEAFNGIPTELTNMRQFWRHSIACGVFARLLGAYVEDVSTERLFVSGLLHDVGRLVMFRVMPEHSAYSLYHSLEKIIPLADVERGLFGFDHSDVGAALMEKWKFPSRLIKNVKFHHSNVPVDLESSILNISDCLAVAFGSAVSVSNIVPSVSEKLWQSLKLSPSVIQPIVSQSYRQIEDIEDVFFAGK